MNQQLYQQASQAHRAGRYAEAENAYRQFLSCQPRHADALHLLGILCYQTERNIEAAELIGKAVELAPRNPDYLINHGLTLRAAGQPERALASYERAMLLSPKDLVLQNNLGNLYQELGAYEKAAACYRKVLRVHDDAEVKQAHCHALISAGNALQETGQYAEAENRYREALNFASSDAALHYNLGNALREQGKPAEAVASYEQAARLSPDDADIHNNLGNALRELGQLDRAIACYEKALTLNPDLHHALVHLVHQKQHACAWQGLPEMIERVRELVNNQPDAQVSPFAFLAMPGTTAGEQRTCADNWVKNRFSRFMQHDAGFTATRRTADQKIRIGYLSADFRLHPLASLISEVVELHDRDHFEIHAYSYGPDDASSERKRLEMAFDRFHEIRHLPHQASAQAIHENNIDILVDLTGFTQSSRSLIAAMRPAPVTVNWLGYPGTMGGLRTENAYTPLFDYIITDDYLTPSASADAYAEQLAMLPHSYQPNDRNRPIGKTPSRADYGLPEDSFVFCCFNQSFKILPDVFSRWMRILQAVPESVLWLLESNAFANANLQREAEAHGISSSRLIFAPRIDMQDHLARHALADLFLDTRPYNAHTTASDALWMCLPVLTCRGDTFASRVGGSLLRAVGLEELIADDLEAYEALAIALARDPEKLADIRDKLLLASSDLSLFNVSEFTRDLERAYRRMWECYVAGMQPSEIHLTPND